MDFKSNWPEARQRFAAWWRHQSTGRPLMNLWAWRDRPLEPPADAMEFADEAQCYLDVTQIIRSQRNESSMLEPLAEAMPTASLNLGAGSMALYLGCEPVFRRESVWFEPCLAGYDGSGAVSFDPGNKWFTRHIAMYRQARELLAGTDMLLAIPDIVENIDIVSAMRGPQQLCYDMYDYPDEVKQAIWKINECYKPCYDAFYSICRDGECGSAFTAFAIWGYGRTAKVQCDHSALISPAQFRDFVLGPLREQCRWLDNSMYHLDGPDCICHVKALMEIDELGALQWTHGDGNPLPGEECWYGLYKQVKDAGKSMWVSLGGYPPDVAADKADRIVKKLGATGFYFHFPWMDRADAEALLIKADREWKC